MPNANVVRIADPRADRPSALGLVAIACCACAVGVGAAFMCARWERPLARAAQPARVVATPAPDAAQGVAESSRASVTGATWKDPVALAADAAARKPRAVSTGPSAEAAHQQPEPVLAVATSIAVRPTPEQTHPEPEQTTDATAAPRPNAPAVASAAPKLSQGFVAYLRCDGVERPGERFPCPRDHALEARVWNSLTVLERCTERALGSGELRLLFRQGGAAKLAWRAPRSSTLNLRAVSKCAGAALEDTRSALRAQRLLVAFHFGLE